MKSEPQSELSQYEGIACSANEISAPVQTGMTHSFIHPRVPVGTKFAIKLGTSSSALFKPISRLEAAINFPAIQYAFVQERCDIIINGMKIDLIRY
ncbi:hypothetical protein I7I50_04315 [Histoplasma capsulatum G186AR]|uniref:Uncharacterized protein n=1 Tax=Ajellomyces capsulatus TaxID=5037 RepID=A0A8H7YQA4_AJECA|nr:hypothetical protein I7I52_05223 [Histoplasma capsulatum]QSS75242.1 hypothetical protein I7I50_04315 [Histoplasma capsulatum G186AR]